MGKRFKFRVTTLDSVKKKKKIGEIVLVDYEEGRVYSEDGEQYIPLDFALKCGIDGERI